MLASETQIAQLRTDHTATAAKLGMQMDDWMVMVLRHFKHTK